MAIIQIRDIPEDAYEVIRKRARATPGATRASILADLAAERR